MHVNNNKCCRFYCSYNTITIPAAHLWLTRAWISPFEFPNLTYNPSLASR